MNIKKDEFTSVIMNGATYAYVENIGSTVVYFTTDDPQNTELCTLRAGDVRQFPSGVTIKFTSFETDGTIAIVGV